MARERLANNAASTLNGAIASGDLTLSVLDASAFPTAGNFRVIIEDELMLVTAVAGTTFTVVRGIEGTTAASHPNGATITQLITEAGMAQLISDGTADPLGGLSPYRIKLARVEAAAFNQGSVVTLCDISGSGMLLDLWITAGGAGAGRDSLVSIYIDDEVTPSIQFDFGVFGTHWQDTAARTSTAHTSAEGIFATGGTIVFRFPVPYSTHVKITVTNESATPVTGQLWGQVFYTEDLTSDLRLKSSNLTYLNRATIASGGNHDFLNLASGHAGVIVWHSLTCAEATSNLFMESDINLKIDGEASPSISATGTEDWFMSGFYFQGGPARNDWSYVSVIDTTNHRMNAGLDLLALCGGIRYRDGVIMNWDCAEMTDTSVAIAYLVLYYEEAA